LSFPGKAPAAEQGQELEPRCGVHPLDQATELALALRSRANGDSELFVSTAGSVRASTTIACAEAMIRARGGVPERSRIGSFVTLRDTALDAPRGALAVRDGGPILLSEPAPLRAMVETVDRRTSSLFDDPLHAALRRRQAGRPVLLATLVLEPGWPERWGVPELSDSPLAATRTLSLGFELRPNPTARIIVDCADRIRCEKLATWLEDTWKRLRELAARLELPMGERLEFRAGQDHVALSAPIDLELLLKGLERLAEASPAPAIRERSPP
jgi:hypothetical protein